MRARMRTLYWLAIGGFSGGAVAVFTVAATAEPGIPWTGSVDADVAISAIVGAVCVALGCVSGAWVASNRT